MRAPSPPTASPTLRMHRSSRLLPRARRPSPAVRASSCTERTLAAGRRLHRGAGLGPTSTGRGACRRATPTAASATAPTTCCIAMLRRRRRRGWRRCACRSTISRGATPPPTSRTRAPPSRSPRRSRPTRPECRHVSRTRRRRRRCRRRSRRPRVCRRARPSSASPRGQDRRAARRVRDISELGSSGGGTPLTVTGNGLTGGDGYRYVLRHDALAVARGGEQRRGCYLCRCEHAALRRARRRRRRRHRHPLAGLHGSALSQRCAQFGALRRRDSPARSAHPASHTFSLYPEWPPWIHVPYSRTAARSPPSSTPSTHPSLAGDSQDGVVELDEITAPNPDDPMGARIVVGGRLRLGAGARRRGNVAFSPSQNRRAAPAFIARFGMRAVAAAATAGDGAVVVGGGGGLGPSAEFYYGVLPHHAEASARPRRGSPSCSTRRGRRMRWR